MTPLLVDAVSKRFDASNAAPALSEVSLSVTAGELVVLLGPSGSGKTTLLRCFNRLVTPMSGVITIGGVDIANESVVALRRRIGYVPQHGGLLLAVHSKRDSSAIHANAEALDFSTCNDGLAGHAHEPVSGEAKCFSVRAAKDNRV